jgi:hypothetical protein
VPLDFLARVRQKALGEHLQKRLTMHGLIRRLV